MYIKYEDIIIIDFGLFNGMMTISSMTIRIRWPIHFDSLSSLVVGMIYSNKSAWQTN